MSFDLKAKRLAARDWLEVAAAWIPHIPPLASPAAPPAQTIDDFPGIEDVVNRAKATGEYRENVVGLRQTVLHEGIFLLHKSAHVLGICEGQARGGMPSWSIATAYQGAFFAKEALLRLLGISIARIADRNITIDVWPAPDASLKGKALRSYKLGDDIQYVTFDHIDHFHRWALLQRLLRMLKNSPLDGDLLKALQILDKNAFASQRNDLHYTHNWPYDDLYAFYTPLNYCRFPAKNSVKEGLESTAPTFSVVLALSVFTMAYTLLRSIASTGGVLGSVVEALREGLSDESRHPVYEEYVKAVEGAARS